MNPPSRLPAPLTALVDRERELALGKALLLDRQIRLVTLTGSPGTGKTRLALVISAAVAQRFPDGVWFVPLAPLADADLVMPTVAHVLGVRALGRRPAIDGLKETLHRQRALLVLDNFEHVLAAGPYVVELLTACPDVAALATSRAPLRVSGEHQLAVPPLELPPKGRNLSVPDLAKVPAIRLFVERAQATRSDFALSDSNAAAITELCVRLDGLPLAIELAAAHTGPLEPWDVLHQLGGSTLLSDGPRDLPRRQRTLRHAIDWSYDLLSADEQRMFRRLAVFNGGCTLEAARSVACLPDEPNIDELGCIAALLNQNLLLRQSADANGTRLAMLETVREYAFDQLGHAGEAECIQQRHADYFASVAESVANPRLDDPDGPSLMDSLERDHDNFRAALRFFIDRKQAEMSTRLAGALWSFWDKRGHRDEAIQWLSSALAIDDDVAPMTRARALIGLAMMHRGRSDFSLAVPHARAAAALMADSGEPLTYAATTTMLADMVSLAGDPDEGALLASEAATLRAGNGHAYARSLVSLGYIHAYRGDFPAAMELFRQALEVRAGENGSEIDAIILLGLGTMHAGVDEFDVARPLLEQALEACRTRGETRSTPRVQLSLGVVLVRQGEHARGRELILESLASFRSQGEALTVVLCSLLLGLPLPTGTRADVTDAALAMAWRASTGRQPPPAEDLEAWAIVRAAASRYGSPVGLTVRETEILQLLARRYSNREIADQLVLSVRTVERHINNLFTKTGLTNRRDALEFCQTHNLQPGER